VIGVLKPLVKPLFVVIDEARFRLVPLVTSVTVVAADVLLLNSAALPW